MQGSEQLWLDALWELREELREEDWQQCDAQLLEPVLQMLRRATSALPNSPRSASILAVIATRVGLACGLSEPVVLVEDMNRILDCLLQCKDWSTAEYLVAVAGHSHNLAEVDACRQQAPRQSPKCNWRSDPTLPQWDLAESGFQWLWVASQQAMLEMIQALEQAQESTNFIGVDLEWGKDSNCALCQARLTIPIEC